MPKLSTSAVILAALALAAIAILIVYQQSTIRALESELALHAEQQHLLDNENRQLERNLHSAGLQLSNLSASLQEATARASECLQSAATQSAAD